MPLQVLQLYLTRRYSTSTWDIHIPLGFGVELTNTTNNKLVQDIPLLFCIESLFILILAVKKSVFFDLF